MNDGGDLKDEKKKKKNFYAGSTSRDVLIVIQTLGH